MASIKLLLGMVPATSKIEQDEKSLIAEFEKLKSFSESKQLARYNELKNLVTSAGFVQKKKEIEKLGYKGSEEFIREKEFNSLKKAKDIVMYFKTTGGTALKRFMELDKSEKISKFEDLKHLVESAGFREEMKSKEFKGSADEKKLAEFKQMNSSTEIREYYKFKKSKEYSNFLNIDGSARLSRYNELKDYCSTKEFSERKNYLLDKKKFEKSQEFRDLTEYQKMSKDPDIIWYLKVKDSNKFDILKNRELLFSDEFNDTSLDTDKWLTRYYWGDKLLKDGYSLDTDLQLYTNTENIEVRNNYLKINTKPQKITGKSWSAKYGFTMREFNFSSGMINTGNSFRQKYGLFTAKIKLGDPNARSTFWLQGDKMTPHINICTTTGGKVWFGLFNGEGKYISTKLGARYSADSFIFSLEWTSSALVWRINGVEVFRQTSNVPTEPLYINFAGGVNKPINGMTSMEVDWVRVYSVKN